MYTNRRGLIGILEKEKEEEFKENKIMTAFKQQKQSSDCIKGNGSM